MRSPNERGIEDLQGNGLSNLKIFHGYSTKEIVFTNHDYDAIYLYSGYANGEFLGSEVEIGSLYLRCDGINSFDSCKVIEVTECHITPLSLTAIESLLGSHQSLEKLNLYYSNSTVYNHPITGTFSSLSEFKNLNEVLICYGKSSIMLDLDKLTKTD